MNTNYLDIRDKCRKGLLKYLGKALSIIPLIENSQILDAGCGTGVPTIFIAEKMEGNIMAVDSDAESIAILKAKLRKYKLYNKVSVNNCSLFDLYAEDYQFDLILAEGILNVVGFRKGFLKIAGLLKNGGYMIIHDELEDRVNKMDIIGKHGCKILESFVLDEGIWWNEYYKCLEREIYSGSNKALTDFFKSDLSEIEQFRKDPSGFNSIYYIIEKQPVP